MARGFRILAMTASALALAACGTPNRGLESVHQPVVERADYAFDVATSGGGLAPGEADRLAGWMSSLRLGYGDRVAVDTGNGEVAVRDDVATQAARYGLLVSDDVPITTGVVARGTARVVVSRMRASVPTCPDHSRVSGIEFEGNTQSNYGCAINSNLAAMVARPEDLVRGQPGTSVSDPATGYKAIESLRKAAPTGAGGLKSETTKGGN
ncbi:CpaD family pilus assembly protein [Sphingomonas donggukensis]|uniref:CpaD family pilus assembly protein n=1 Tax=Sphingomonas donggukensis TaxID=2949093 RepID=A0ABY4TUL8_9SPHN|nr:CpaD family pilus assembly protein [Sphingomonas donggukensis]URW75982.1 CpaD family pilus assembly protein [Sphingomonas donggukensis]